MLRLDSTLRKLEVVLAGAVATTQPSFVASWSDATSISYTGGSTPGVTAGAAAVTAVAAPGAGVIRDVDYLTVRNGDTAAVVLTVQYNDNGTVYGIITVTLASGSQLTYTHGSGWQVIDAAGSLKSGVTGPAGGAGIQGAVGVPVYLVDDPLEPEPMIVQGQRGFQGIAGTTGLQGSPGVPVHMGDEPIDEIQFYLVAGMLGGNGPAFSASLATIQSITASNTFQKVIFGTEEFDTANAYNPATGTFTVPVDGFYQVSSCLTLAGTGTSNGQCTLYKNGVIHKFLGSTATLGGTGSSSTLVKCVAGDTLEIYGKITGISLSVSASVTSTFFSAVLVRAA